MFINFIFVRAILSCLGVALSPSICHLKRIKKQVPHIHMTLHTVVIPCKYFKWCLVHEGSLGLHACMVNGLYLCMHVSFKPRYRPSIFQSLPTYSACNGPQLQGGEIIQCAYLMIRQKCSLPWRRVYRGHWTFIAYTVNSSFSIYNLELSFIRRWQDQDRFYKKLGICIVDCLLQITTMFWKSYTNPAQQTIHVVLITTAILWTIIEHLH